MWHLRTRSFKSPPEWSEVGDFADLTLAVEHMMNLEQVKQDFWLDLHTDLNPIEESPDFPVIRRLEHIGRNVIYRLEWRPGESADFVSGPARPQWNLSRRPHKPPRDWTALGTYADLNGAIFGILDRERVKKLALKITVFTISFRKSDSDLMRSFVYASREWYYTIQETTYNIQTAH
jgi:hypothetical protein